MNIREDIESAIVEKCHVYEIEYLNSSGINRCWHICDIQYSEEFGDSHIIAHVNELHKDLTFSIERILRFEKYWVDIIVTGVQTCALPIWLLVCRRFICGRVQEEWEASCAGKESGQNVYS